MKIKISKTEQQDFKYLYIASVVCLLLSTAFIAGNHYWYSYQSARDVVVNEEITEELLDANLVQDELGLAIIGSSLSATPDQEEIVETDKSEGVDGEDSQSSTVQSSVDDIDVRQTDPEFTLYDRRNPFLGQSLFVSAHDPAGDTASSWVNSNPSGASALNKISGKPVSVWITRGTSNLSSYVGNIVQSAQNKSQMPVLVVYGMPAEGCSGLPASADDYITWVTSIKNAIGSRQVSIIMEPDELPIERCSDAQESQRLQVLARAVGILRQNSRAHIYIDAGHSNWVGAADMADRLTAAGVLGVQGFSLNVSNYRSTAESSAYGQRLSNLLNGAHFVIDTSRNGLGPSPDNEWCNAPGRALGEQPGSGSGRLDAYLWIKYPGESDLACNGGPAEGQWWPEYAVGLAERAAW